MADKMTLYESEPPTWIPPAHGSANLGHAGFDPPHPSQKEEILTTTAVQDGYSFDTFPAESFSARGLVVAQDREMYDLESLMNAVTIRRTTTTPSIPSSTFRLPTRVTLNDTKRQAWFTDLANPDIPLSNLGKSVPHGAKGGDLLDLLQSHNVPIPRAVWFLRVFGANETLAARTKPGYDPTLYSIEWATVVTNHLKKQLSEIALPTTAKGFNIKITFKSVLAETDTRERWVNRFTYFLDLLRLSYDDGMVDKRTFLSWVIHQLASSNLGQASFVVCIAENYIDDIVSSRPFAYHLAVAVIDRLVELRNQDMEELEFLRVSLTSLAQRILIQIPDAFVSPRLWYAHDEIIVDLFATSSGTEEDGSVCERVWSVPNAQEVDDRVRSLLFLDETNDTRLGTAVGVTIVNMLNDFRPEDNIARLAAALFDVDAVVGGNFTKHVHVLLSWVVTTQQYGIHRPYLAVALLREWLLATEHDYTRPGQISPPDLLQDTLFAWLDRSSAAVESGCEFAVADLYGKLIESGLFSFEAYLQRLLVRDEKGMSFETDSVISRHRSFVRDIPLISASTSIHYQRKALLYGVRARSTPEEINERRIKEELQTALSPLFNDDSSATSITWSELQALCPTLVNSRPYEQVRVLVKWLLPILLANGNAPNLSCAAFILYVYILEAHGCMRAVYDLAVHLSASQGIDVLHAAIAMMKPHMQTWACLGILSNVLQLAKTADYVSDSISAPRSVAIPTGSAEDEQMYEILATRPADNRVQKICLDIETKAAANFDMNVFDNLANQLGPALVSSLDDTKHSYHDASLWSGELTSWADLLHAVSAIVSSEKPTGAWSKEARRMSDLRVSSHLDPRQWSATDKQRSTNLSDDGVKLFVIIVTQSCARGTLRLPDVLEHLVYAEWTSSIVNEVEVSVLEALTPLHISFMLFKFLVLNVDLHSRSSEITWVQTAHLRAFRQDIFRGAEFWSLLRGLGSLGMLRDHPTYPASIHEAATKIVDFTVELEVFRQTLHAVIAFEYLNRQDHQLRAVEREAARSQWVASVCQLLSQLPIMHEMLRVTSVQTLPGTPWEWMPVLFAAQADMNAAGDNAAQLFTPVLDALIERIAQPNVQTEDLDLVSEWVNSLSTGPIRRFLEEGIRQITKLLARELEELDHEAISKFLTFTAGITASRRDRDLDIPRLASDLLNALSSALEARFRDALSMMSRTETNGRRSLPKATESVSLLALVLHLRLGFAAEDGPKTANKQSETTMINNIFDLILSFGSLNEVDESVFSLLIDTLYYYLDFLTSDGRVLDWLTLYPIEQLSNLDRLVSMRDQRRFRQLFPIFGPHAAVAGLVQPIANSINNNVSPHAVVNHPWEWTEYLGDASIQPHQGLSVKSTTSNFVKNSASLSLDLFSAENTGETRSTLTASNELVPEEFYDKISAQTIFMRSWLAERLPSNGMDINTAQVRSAQDDRSAEAHMWTSSMPSSLRVNATSAVQSGSRPGSRTASPTSAVHRGPWFQAPTRASPVGMGLTPQMVGTPGGSRQAVKRKAQPDEDLPISEGPATSTPATQASAKPRPAGRASGHRQ